MIWGTEMASQQYRSQFGDTTLTKVFVGGLAWETPTEEMRRYFDQFGEILEAVIITDKATDKSKGYGFVTFRDPESARRACADPNPVIDGRKANCNIASFGRPRPSPPRGRNHGGQGHHGGGGQQAATSYGRILAPPPPPFIYPPYGYTAYPPEYGYHQAVYNNQFPSQYYYGTSSSSIGPYPYGHAGYPLQASGPTFSVSQRHRLQLPPYQYLAYPPPGEGSRTPPSPSPSQPYNFTSPTPIWLSFPPSDPQPHNEPSTAAAAETSATAKRSSS